ncbi:MAG: glycosyltransferase family 39 protein [bacterium]|nr:glycosyltransferase family 39 protein [bacterium]
MKMLKLFTRKRENKEIELASLGGILALFLALTLPTLGAASIWFDEAFSAYIIRHDFAQIWHYTSVDVHPPLYYFALKVWSFFFGTSDFALRSMSVFFGALTLILAFYLIKRIFKSVRIAGVSTFFLAISPMFIRYSQEMRMYMLVAFFALIAIRAFFEIYHAQNSEKNQKKWRIIFVLASLLGIWTQYLSGIVLITLWLWRAWMLRKDFRKGKKGIRNWLQRFFSEKWFALNAWVVVGFLPWIPFFLIQTATVQAGFWIPDVTFNTLPNYISNFFTFVNSGDLKALWCLAIFAIIGISIYLISKNRGISKAEKQNLAFIGTLSFLPAAVLFVASSVLKRSIFVDRYVLFGLIFMALFLGILIAKAWQKERLLAKVLALLLVITFGYGIFEINRQTGFSKSSNSTTQTRQMVERIHQLAQPDEPIIAESGYFYYELAQYSTAKNSVWFIDSSQDYSIGSLKMLEDDNQHKITNIADFSKKYSAVWVVYNYGDTEKEPLDSSWKMVQQETYKDPITGANRYLIQKFLVEN